MSNSSSDIDTFLDEHETHGEGEHITTERQDDGDTIFTCLPCNRSLRATRAEMDARNELHADILFPDKENDKES